MDHSNHYPIREPPWHCFGKTHCMEKKTTASMHEDIHDSKRDEQRLQPDMATLDLPDVKDIPGQEHIHPPKFKEYADVTASSDDEEGKGIIGFDDDELEADEETDVTEEEKELLEQSENSMGTEDDEDRRKATLDNTDNEGVLLNEQNDQSGEDLDVPGSEDDDENEELGEEDEENNSYSLGGDRKD
jgi:hypothetical protein